MKAPIVLLLCLGPLAACGQTGQDPAETSAPPEAVTSNPAAQMPQTQTPEQGAPPAYQQDSAANTADRVDTTTTQDLASSPPQADPLAECRDLDTTQRSDCELRVRQGLDADETGTDDDIAATPRTPPTDRATPPEALPAPVDSSASTADTSQEDDDR